VNGVWGRTPEQVELCSRIREATATAPPPDDWTTEELRALADLMESVVAAHNRDELPVRLAELIDMGAAGSGAR
jgi:hypothetical protein